jgi:hypothetical protein
MAVNLIASGSLEARKLEVSGWLHPCSGANGCTASDPAVAVANGQSGEIREDFSMDFSTLASHLIYTRPAGSDTYGYRYSIYYDYAANLLVGAKSALTGDLVLLNQQGNPVPGGKLADLKVGADNNIEIDYVTGATASWKL